jgi:hypothetical protein
MNIWLEYTKPSGRVIIDNLMTFSPVFVGIFADVPDTWNTAGRIYFFSPKPEGKLLLGTEFIYLNYFHQAIFQFPGEGYNVVFQPVNYLRNYTIKIGHN